MNKRWYGLKVAVLALCVLGFSGCALLNLPGQVVGGAFSTIGKLLGVIKSVPKPPPWVFL